MSFVLLTAIASTDAAARAFDEFAREVDMFCSIALRSTRHSESRVGLTTILVFAALFALTIPGLADTVPVDGMIITTDTTFAPGTYSLPNGVSIGAPGITLNMNGAVLVGDSFGGYGVSCVGHDDVVIENGTMHGYYYGILVETCDGVTIRSNDFSYNWIDPASLGAYPPFLNINVGPNLGDRTNLGGGLFMRDVSHATVADNIAAHQENGIDLYEVRFSTISGNDASDNTGWGIHLYSSTDNVICNNTADYCIRAKLNDSAGVLVVFGSHRNQFLNNSFQHGGDGFFIGNEWGCPSNDNLIQGNNGSYAGANAFEATFSAGNQFIDNIASGSNYGFWLGYSHDGTTLVGNVIRSNNTNGIEIEHGQHNTITDNVIVGNGGRGIVLRTDNHIHFPSSQFPCLDLPDQANSSDYTISGNIIYSNFGHGLELTNTTDSLIYNNLIANNLGGTTAVSNGTNNTWAIAPVPGTNIVGGPFLAGNYWYNYASQDENGDGLGDSDLPYTNGGQIAAPGDPSPLVGEPNISEALDNPLALCDRAWIDLGRNTHSDGSTFDTGNGTHYATDGIGLYLLESADGTGFSRFDPTTGRYVPRATIPESVWDGGDLQWGDGCFYATVGIAFTPADGTGKGSYLYSYDPNSDSWSAAARTQIDGILYAQEALAYDPVHNRLYATILGSQTGGDANALYKLAIYDRAADAWTGFTAPCSHAWGAGTDAEYLDGHIYVWRGGLSGGAVNGADSYLDVYDIDADTWSQTPTLLDTGVVPGFRSGGFDVWGVTISADAERHLLFVLGAESNRQIYVFDVMTQSWAAAAPAPYDGGWGAGLEWVADQERLYQIDGRNANGAPQGTATLVVAPGDANLDGTIDYLDFQAYEACMAGPDSAIHSGCRLLDADCDGDADMLDFAGLQAAATGS